MRLILLLLAMVLATTCPLPVRAQNEAVPGNLPYSTEFTTTGNGPVDAALAAVSQLRQLQETAPTDAAGIVARATADADRLRSALDSEGFWAGQPRVELAGRDPATPNLAETLAAQSPPILARISAELGPRYRLRLVEIRAPTPAEQAVLDQATTTPFGLTAGDPAVARAVLDAERTLLDRLLNAGYPLASQARRAVTVDHDSRTMDVVWQLAPGPFARFAVPQVAGTQRVDPNFVATQAAPLAGQPFSPAALERQRSLLAGLGAFSAVRARAAERLDASGRLPVTFTVAERPRHAIGGSVAYETNFGPSIRAWWEHRNLLGRSERLRLEAEVSRIGVGNAGSATNMTYRVGSSFIQPGVFDLAGVTLRSSAYYLRERLDAYDRDAITADAILQRPLTERLVVRGGPQLDIGRIGPPGGTQTPYQILGLLLGARWDATDSLLNPTRGWRLDGMVTPSLSLSNTEPFMPLRLTGTAYWDLFGDKGSVLAARGSVGSLLGGSRLLVPRHLRFYAGGGGSVRGYDYQSIGPRDERNRPSGGASVVEASLEWRQHVYGNFGAVGFVDAGNVGTGSLPQGAMRLGAGMGVRYLTPIGPIRADVAVPLVAQRGSSGYGLYLGIGQAF